MKNFNITSGRVQQKMKTRSDILKAAQNLMHAKTKLTLEAVAESAGISRATMYRYYSDLDLLIMEATLDMQHKPIDDLVEEVQYLGIRDKILSIQEYYNNLALNNEIVFRRYLSASLAESITSLEPLRGARRIKVLHRALEPFKEKLSQQKYNRLIHISSVLMGIDAVLTCRDVCRLDNEEIQQTLRWALESIIKDIV